MGLLGRSILSSAVRVARRIAPIRNECFTSVPSVPILQSEPLLDGRSLHQMRHGRRSQFPAAVFLSGADSRPGARPKWPDGPVRRTGV
jgi:hypothetical protein